MHAHTKFVLALGLSLIAGTLQAAPWEHAGSKLQSENSNNQVRRTTCAYSYSPPATSAMPTVAQPQAAVAASAGCRTDNGCSTSARGNLRA